MIAIPCYVAGPENRLVAGAVNHLIESAKPSTLPPSHLIASPMLLMGPSGSGKTHLAHGLAEEWGAQRGRDRVAYFTAGDFCRQVASAIADREINDLRQELRRRELLVIDDLHRLAGERYAIEELVHTIDAICAGRGLLLATSATSPAETPRLGSSLTSRLLSGAVLAISPLAEASRQELLRLALESLGCRATPDAVELLAHNAPNDPRRLFSLAVRLRRQVRSNGLLDRRLAMDLAGSSATRQSPPARDILAIVAKYYGLPKSKMTSSSRQQTTVLARGVAIYLIRELTPLSYDQIGKLLGGRDHTTIIHNFRRIDRGIATDRVLRDAVDELRGSIQAVCPS